MNHDEYEQTMHDGSAAETERLMRVQGTGAASVGRCAVRDSREPQAENLAAPHIHSAQARAVPSPSAEPGAADDCALSPHVVPPERAVEVPPAAPSPADGRALHLGEKEGER